MTKGNSMRGDTIRWVSTSTISKYRTRADWEVGSAYEVVGSGPNMLLTAGASLIWSLVTGGSGTPFNASNAYIAVGDGTASAAAGQTDLQGTNKFRKLVTSAPVLSTNQATFAATFGDTDALFTWQEWGLANASSGGVLLNRFLQNRGTKGAEFWDLSITLALV